MNSGIEGNSYGAVISPTRIIYKIGQGSNQVVGDALLIGTNDDEVNYGSTQRATDLILQMPMLYNNGVYVSSGALSLQIPDGTVKCGNTRGIGAVDLQTIRGIATQVASSSYSTAIGGYNTASGYSSTAIGCQNTAAGGYTVAMGDYSIAAGSASVAIGYGSTVNGDYAVGIGVQNLASGFGSVAVGWRGSTNGISSKVATGTVFSQLAGTYQMGQLGLGAITTDATATVLKSDTYASSASNQCALQNNNAMSFTIEVVARNTSTGMTGRWEAKGLIKRGANASATALVGTPTVTLTNGDSEAWIVAGAIAITADTTNGALAITVTGAASTTIHWLAKILTTEII
jgi:hypothetical protein